MSKVYKNYEVDRRILNCQYISDSLSVVGTISFDKSQIYTKIPREVSVISLINSYLHKNFHVVEVAVNSKHAYSNDIRLVNLGPVALFGKFRLTSSSGKQLEDFSYAHIASLKYKQ